MFDINPIPPKEINGRVTEKKGVKIPKFEIINRKNWPVSAIHAEDRKSVV